MNLIKDKWIPVKIKKDKKTFIAPWEIGSGSAIPIEIAAYRPDFRSVLYQFLIGLFQTVYAPEDIDEWEEKWTSPPSNEDLYKVLIDYSDFFELYDTDGTAFMQDFDQLDGASTSEIRALLIDSPGENAIKKNLDHFVKGNIVTGLCDSCTATALYCLQTNAPAGGQGNRTGLRGGGPLTTIILPNKNVSTIWEIVWLNILTKDDRIEMFKKDDKTKIFPWLRPTKLSTNNEETHPNEVSSLQMFWGMPRRIRLHEHTEQGRCDICGKSTNLWTSYKSQNKGTNYSSLWKHCLSPYRKEEDKDGKISLISLKGKQGNFTYTNWLSLTIRKNDDNEPAENVNNFLENKACLLKDNNYRIWCNGYDMDNMKSRCWYDEILPFIVIEDTNRSLFISVIEKMIDAADSISYMVQSKVKEAWFSSPKDHNGDMSFIRTEFINRTKSSFYNLLYQIQKMIQKNDSYSDILESWRKELITNAEQLFNNFALQNTDNPKNMKRIADAAASLHKELYVKNKPLQSLKEPA